MNLIITAVSKSVLMPLGANFLILTKDAYPDDIYASQIHKCLNAAGYTVKVTGSPNGVTTSNIEIVIALASTPSTATKTAIVNLLLDTTKVRTYQ
jgi:hypothetical protein